MAFTIVGDAAIISGGVDPTKPAAVFTGGNTDDYYQVDALAAARTAANDTAGTIIAWINTGDTTSTGSIICFGDKNVVEFIDFNVQAGKIGAAVTDGTVAKWATATSSAVLSAHTWYHIALVQGGRPKIYLNGVLQTLTDSVTTDLTTWFNPCDGIDSGRIGAGNIAGDDSVTQEFVGAITEVKYYNTALTQTQIDNDFRGQHLSTGCIAWYKMDALTDYATGGGTYDMTAVSDVYLTPSYNNFISKFRKFGCVAADVVGIAENHGKITALVVNAA